PRNNLKLPGQMDKSLLPPNERGNEIQKVPTLGGSSPPAEVAVSDPSLAQAFKATQENLFALQRFAEQTAQVHRQFLEGQDKSLQLFQALLAQQALISRNVPTNHQEFAIDKSPESRVANIPANSSRPPAP